MSYLRIDAPLVDRIELDKTWHDLPGGPEAGLAGQITPKSPLKFRKAVQEMAYYFKREMKFDFVQFATGDKQDPYIVYVWNDPSVHYGNYATPLIGAACFRPRGDICGLQWVWIHPYHRRQKLLTKAWPFFQEMHGGFDVEGPYSQAMLGFLKKTYFGENVII